jgi:hypothetical protein
MRKEFVTPFWQHAYENLPKSVRAQYLTQMRAAERWELSIGALIEFGSRLKNAVLKLLQTPSRAH